MELYRSPAQSVTSIKYYDADGVLQTWDSSNYILDKSAVPSVITTAPDISYPDTQNRSQAVQIEYVAGYGDTGDDVPAAIRQAILMLASDIYEHPEANVELKLSENKTLGHLLAAYHVPWLGGDWE